MLELAAFAVAPMIARRRPDADHTIRRILLIEPFQMGDVLSLTVMLDPLQAAFPRSDIWVLTKEKNKEVLAIDNRISGVLTTVFPWSNYSGKLGAFSDWMLLAKFLYAHHGEFDVGIDTRGDIRSQVILLLLGCRIRLGYTRYFHTNLRAWGLLLTHKAGENRSAHRYDWNREILRALTIDPGKPVLPPVLHLPERLSKERAAFAPVILVHIGGGWRFKRWSNAKWIALIRELKTLGLTEVIAGSTEEPELKIVQSGLPEINCSVTRSYEDLVLKIQSADLFVCLDSGPMNLAVLLGKSVLALFGPGDSEMWRPYVNGQFIHKKEEFPCNPCAQRTCVFPDSSCMDKIEVSEVLAAAKKMLGRNSKP